MPKDLENMELVLIESPYAGDVEVNLTYLRECMRDCFQRGQAPFASHALYTQPGVLDDGKPDERQLGIDAGLLWGSCASKTVVYVDRGFSGGMAYGVKNAVRAGRAIELRSLDGWRGKKTREAVDEIAKWAEAQKESMILAGAEAASTVMFMDAPKPISVSVVP